MWLQEAADLQLIDDLEDLTLVHLQKQLRIRSLQHRGNKSACLERLKNYLIQRFGEEAVEKPEAGDSDAEEQDEEKAEELDGKAEEDADQEEDEEDEGILDAPGGMQKMCW